MTGCDGGRDLDMILGRKELKERMHSSPPLVENMVDPERQIGPNGVDLTLEKVEIFETPGTIDFDHSRRIISECSELPFDESGRLQLKPGAYKITFNEIINLPDDLTAIARTRSTLLRCGASIETALWDAGYRGRGISMLVVHNKNGVAVEKNARLLQLIFLPLSSPTDAPYKGVYYGENV